MELDLNLFDLEIQDIKIWQFIRHSLFEFIQQEVGIIGEAHTRVDSSFWAKAKVAIKSIPNYIFKNPHLSGQSYDVLVLPSQRRKLEEGGKYWDLHFDPLANSVSFDYKAIEFHYLDGHLKPAQTNNLDYFDYTVLKANLRKRRVSFDFTVEEKSKINEINDYIQKHMKTNYKINRHIEDQIILMRAYRPLFEKLLDKLNPKVVLITVGYSDVKQIFVYTCRKMGISTAELQHGIISKHHLGYNFPESVKEKITKSTDYLLTFGDYWSDAVNFPSKKENIISIGYAYLEYKKRQLNAEQINDRDKILILSQGIADEVISNFTLKLIDLIPKDRIIYKLHPSEYRNWEEKYPKLATSGITIVGDSGPSLYELFAISSVQIGVSSFALIEGLTFNCLTFLIKHADNQHFTYLINEGLVTVIQTPEELIMYMDNDENNGNFEIEKFYKPDALQNFIQFLQRFDINATLDKQN